MADPNPAPRKNAFEEMFDRPITRPDNDEGMGPILGEDVSVEHPSTVEVDRGREQGLGVGEKDLQRQRDPGDGLGSQEQSAGVDADDEEDTGDGFGRAEPVS